MSRVGNREVVSAVGKQLYWTLDDMEMARPWLEDLGMIEAFKPNIGDDDVTVRGIFSLFKNVTPKGIEVDVSYMILNRHIKIKLAGTDDVLFVGGLSGTEYDSFGDVATEHGMLVTLQIMVNAVFSGDGIKPDNTISLHDLMWGNEDLIPDEEPDSYDAFGSD